MWPITRRKVNKNRYKNDRNEIIRQKPLSGCYKHIQVFKGTHKNSKNKNQVIFLEQKNKIHEKIINDILAD